MIHPGEIVIVHDPDIRDMYCARIMKQGDEIKMNVLVQIIYMIRYPIQHAVVYTDRANENPPIPEGTICRLKFVRRCQPGEEHFTTYDDSFYKCLDTYVKNANIKNFANMRNHVPQYPFDPKEFEILTRHTHKKFNKKRAIWTE
jgi:hypothetical protein